MHRRHRAFTSCCTSSRKTWRRPGRPVWTCFEECEGGTVLATFGLKTAPLATGEDGKAVLEAIYAAYESARTGAKVRLPFTPPDWATKPIHCWKPWLALGCPPELRR